MSYRDIQTGIGLAEQGVNFLGSIPGLNVLGSLVSDVVGAFGTAAEQQRYNDMIFKYYATPVSQGGGYNPGTKASRAQMLARQRRHFATYFH